MKRHRLWLTMTAACCILSACSGDKDEPADTARVPISLGTGITTRAQGQDTQLEAGQQVYVWAKHTGTETEYLRAWQLTADGSGGLTPATVRYYPADGTNLDLYALHGNFSSSFTESTTPNFSSSADATDGTACPTTVTHTVKTSQASIEDYAASDLFAVKVANVGPHNHANLGNTYSVQLPFIHQLARLEVAIVNFNDLLPEDIESITLCGVKTQTSLTMPVSTSEDHAIGTMGETAETPTADIVMHPIDDDAATRITKAECVIPAQSLTSPTLIVVELKNNVVRDNDKLYYRPVYKDGSHPDGCVFELYNGVTYRLELTISKVELTGFRVGWMPWNWKALFKDDGTSNLTDAEDGLLYYFPQEMNTSESSFASYDVNGNQNYSLDWIYGGTGSDAGYQTTKGNEWFDGWIR